MDPADPTPGPPGPSAALRGRRGRPAALSDAERRARILDAMDEIFAQAGIEGLSMNAVARHAGMSKRTLYTIFADRTAMFLAYLERLKDSHIRSPQPADCDAPIETRLRRLLGPVPVATGLQLPLSILRAIVAEVPARPEVGVRLVESACVGTTALLRGDLDRAAARGEIAPGDTAAQAALLLDMLRPPPFEALLCPDRLPDDEARRARFDLALAVFLDGVRLR